MQSNFDAGSNILPNQSIAPAAQTGTATGAFVDTQGYNGALILVDVGTVTTADISNLFTFTVTGSDSADGSGATAIDSALYVNPTQNEITTAVNSISVWDRLINATTETTRCSSFGVPMNQLPYRYINVVATMTGTASSVFGASIILTNPTDAPAGVYKKTA